MGLVALAELTARLDDPFADRDAVLRAAGLDESAYAQQCAEWSARLEQQEHAQAFGDAYARVREGCSSRRRARSSEEPIAAPTDAHFLNRDAQPWREQASAVPLSAAEVHPPVPLGEPSAPPQPSVAVVLPKVVRPPAALAATADMPGFVPGAALPFVAGAQPPAPMRGPSAPPQPSVAVVLPKVVRAPVALAATADMSGFVPSAALPFAPGPVALPASSAAPSGTTDVAGFVPGPAAPFVASRRMAVGAETADIRGFVPRAATPFEAAPVPQRRLVRFDPQTGERLAEPRWEDMPEPSPRRR